MELKCYTCSKHMGTIRDGNFRSGMIVYCKPCNDRIKALSAPPKHDMPDFMKGLFR